MCPVSMFVSVLRRCCLSAGIKLLGKCTKPNLKCWKTMLSIAYYSGATPDCNATCNSRATYCSCQNSGCRRCYCASPQNEIKNSVKSFYLNVRAFQLISDLTPFSETSIYAMFGHVVDLLFSPFKAIWPWF